ncbi:hypothetical protein EVAR_46127_1 [Eumeta japonica]|uniref:Uncharacterized protein n=1 Tax=Eumeta variegata TaxID=151549 RepID=A0A4C1XP52_EUMVA|nr:hypothetical protein EVAR_46127_1 [Eumeta japonica]
MVRHALGQFFYIKKIKDSIELITTRAKQQAELKNKFLLCDRTASPSPNPVSAKAQRSVRINDLAAPQTRNHLELNASSLNRPDLNFTCSYPLIMDSRPFGGDAMEKCIIKDPITVTDSVSIGKQKYPFALKHKEHPRGGRGCELQPPPPAMPQHCPAEHRPTLG